jgi:DMSO/TMAO reductase YedYZ heme-binding membrane subunit
MMVTIVVVILLLRLTILFPAIAVGARGATAGDALADSKGHVFSIFLIFTLALLPLTAISLGVTSLLGRDMMSRGTPVALIGLALDSVIHVTSLVLCVAIASRIFQAIGNRLRISGPAR